MDTAKEMPQQDAEFCKQVIENIAEGIAFIRAQDCNIIYANRCFKEIFAYSLSDMTDLSLDDLYADKGSHTPPSITESISQSICISGEWQGELLSKKGDNTSFYGMFKLSRYNHPSEGELWVMLASDITEQKQAQDSLELSAKVIETAAEGVIITDKDSTVIYVNPAFEKITGYQADELIGKTPAVWKSERHGKDFYREVWKSVKKNGFWSGEVWNRRCTGDIFPANLTINGIQHKDGTIKSYAAVMHDLTAIKLSQKETEFKAYYDSLTGLPNRNLLLERLDHRIKQSKRDGSVFGFLFIDLDDFKKVNDTLGHLAGDRLLINVGARLIRNVRDSDTVSRLGGDEYVVLMDRLRTDESAGIIAARILKDLVKPILIGDKEIFISSSIGIVLSNGKEGSNEIFKNADLAMYKAKELGKNNYCYYNKALNDQEIRNRTIEKGLRKAIKSRELKVYYQPKVDVLNGLIYGAEALVRWRKGSGEFISPSDFIPVAESAGLIHEIGILVINESLEVSNEWYGCNHQPLKISFNLSPKQFRNEYINKYIDLINSSSDLDPSNIEVEVTEGVIMADVDHALSVMKRLKDAGVKLSLDDFGTGYSSLSYLQRFPFDTLKIDRSFVLNMIRGDESKSLVSAIISIGKIMNLKVVAEGVENLEQYNLLRDYGCDYIQGFLISPPVEKSAFENILEQEHQLPTGVSCIPYLRKHK